MSDRSSAPFPWQGKRVFLTGHTGFKGGWLALWLAHKGAVVRGYSLDPYTTPSLVAEARIAEKIEDIRGDIRNPATLDPALTDFAPEVVFHLAAQPLVRLSYSDPIGTYETNVIGTARVLDAVRRTPSVKAVVSITTDKCYENKEWLWGYRETDPLGGYDPYSSSKACAEIVSAAFRQSFFQNNGVNLATARAGNVIGGGDWSLDRLIPDLVRGFLSGAPVPIRRPHSIRPWQHVLEPLHGYITLSEKLLSAEGARYAQPYNFGPADDDAREVAWIADHMVQSWNQPHAGMPLQTPQQPAANQPQASWVLDEDPSVHEAGYLKLDASRATHDLAWHPRLHLADALDWIVRWYRAHAEGHDMQAYTLNQILDYEALLASPR